MAVGYALLLTVNLSNMPMHWDEVNHFTGGLHLIRGEITEYFLTSSFYPPMFNLVTAGYFTIGGASVFAARLVAVTFALLSVVAVFEFASFMYGPKTALISSLFFCVMPGVVWLSRVALIETMLIFIFTLSMLYFFKWLTTNHEKNYTRSVAAFVLGIAVKYQMLVVAPLTMIASMLIFGKRGFLKNQTIRLFKLPRVIVVIIAAFITAFALYELYAAGLLGIMWHAVTTGTTEKAVYSVRFPTPVFYLVEMVWSTSETHPISFLLYILGLAGLGLFIYRRKPQDKFLLVWFAVIYAVFTVIPNREWRYVVPLFPVLAVSAASLLTHALNEAQENWKPAGCSFSKRHLAKFAAAALVAFVGVGFFFSCSDAYRLVMSDQNQVLVEEASIYAATLVNSGGSIMVACPLNLINSEMVWFCINARTPAAKHVWQYPELAADAYTPDFKVTEFVNVCQKNDVQTVLLYEYGSITHYFNSTLTPKEVSNMLTETGRFALQQSFGIEPRRVFVFSFS
jgi:hypothetical protein